MMPGYPPPATAVTAPLAAFCSGLKYADIPPQVQLRAKMFVLDAIGIILGAVPFNRQNHSPELEKFLSSAAPDGPSTILGLGIHTTPMMAAFANGTLSEVLDFQDTDMSARIHNGVTVIPAALAVAQRLGGVSGRQFLTAIVAGYEVGSRLSAPLQPAHWYRGFQATGTFGTCAAAAAAALLLNLNEEGVRSALGASGLIMPVTNSDNVFKGYSIKPVHGGQPAMCGVQAALMAQAGFAASLLEGEPPRHQGVLNMLGQATPDLTTITSGLGDDWRALLTAFKPYPVGLVNIGPVEVCLKSLQRFSFTGDQIARMRVSTYKDAVAYTGGKYTSTDSNHVDCYLSMPYCIAASLSDGRLGPEQLTHARIRDAKVHQLASRVQVIEDSKMTARYPREFPVRIEFQLEDGRNVAEEIDQFRWSPARPPEWAGIENKFRSLVDPLIGPGKANRIATLVRDLDEVEEIKGLLGELASIKL